MARLDHTAIWVKDLEKMRSFYEKYFNARSNDKYINRHNEFQSYFLEFESGPKLELMQRPDVEYLPKSHPDQEFIGYSHLSFAVGSLEDVNEKSEQLELDGYRKIDGPRFSGIGFYESTFLDPEGNRVEITT